MPGTLTRQSLGLATPALSVLNIGTWEDDTGVDRVTGDAVMARIFGVSEEAMAHGIPWFRLREIFHPDDLGRDTEQRRRVREEGGLFVWEHRIIPSPGNVRWVLARGHFARDTTGCMHGRGIVIDVTDSRLEAGLDGPPRFFGETTELTSIVERMADAVLSAWEMAGDLDKEANQRLRPLIEMLLHALGHEIAASLRAESQGEMPILPRDPRMH